MKKTIITVVGKDTVGIIARVCTYLAENNVNILDISQTIVQGYFNMMMVTDATKCEKSAAQIADMSLKQSERESELSILCQHEDIFNMMHRI
ncbi:MAG: ACT domain-containing protein [Lachnospiraceae bacterium]